MTAIEEQARSIFLGALERAPAHWPTYVADACGGNPELLARVEQLLRTHQAMGSIHGGGDESPPATILHATREGPGTVIGPFKVLQQLGEGGMGTVFMAEQSQPVQRKVALKIIKPGMDSRQVVARFEAERQALALMDHPNIAKVLDAGTTESGRPYFVMELVKGVSITRYCDEHRLTPKQRLELFVPVCQAVQHAHQKGVIHRDLKPSNVLIAEFDDKPVAKVIDFGVAKATGAKLTERTMFTELGQIVGTLEYMSPEQAKLNALDIDTRSDIYALGVMLYELMTGTTPLEKNRFRLAAFDEMLRIIREEEPPKPSTRLSMTDELPSIAANRGLEPKRLSGLMRGELDWIVMKALEKDRNRRYETANSFAQDIQRYLADEAVQACPPSAWYRLQKFTRRNKRPVLAASIILILLFSGIVSTTVGLVRAVKAERDATAQRQQTQQNLKLALKALDEIYLQVAEERLPRDPQRKKEDSELLEKALDFYQQFAQQNNVDPLVRSEVGRAFRRVGDIQRFVGEQATARQAYESAIAKFQELTTEFPTDPEYHRELAAVHNALGAVLGETGEESGAAEQFRNAIDLLARLTADYPSVGQCRAELARSHHGLGKLLKQKGQRSAAEASFREALDIQTHLTAEFATEPQYRLDLAETHRSLGWWMEGLNLYGTTEEVEHMRRASELLTELVAEFPHAPLYRYLLAMTLQNLATFAGQNAGRMDYYNEAIVHLTKLTVDYPQVPEYRVGLSKCHGNFGTLWWMMGDWDTAGRHFRQGLDLCEKLAAEYPGANHYKEGMSVALGNFATTLVARGEFSQARKALEDALRHARELLKAYPSNSRHAAIIVLDDYLLSGTVAALGQGAEAAKLRQDADQLFDETWKQVRDTRGSFSAARFCVDVANQQEDTGNVWGKSGNHQEMTIAYTAAIKAFGQAIELEPQGAAWLHQESTYDGQSSDSNPWLRRAGVYELLGQHDMAIADYLKSIELMPGDAMAHYNLGNVLRDNGDLPGASDAFQKAIALMPDYAEAHCNLGDVLRRQGEFHKAVEELRLGDELGSKTTRWPYPSAQWVRHCERLVELDGQLPGFFEGKAAPASPEERIELAGLCSLKRLNLAAARFYEEAFVAEPNLSAAHRYNAACAASLAALGQVEGAPPLADTAKAKLRNQSLDWLQADLTALGKLIESGDLQARPAIVQTLSHWQRDPDLAGIRDAAALAKLLADEQQAFTQLWTDVAALLKKAEETLK